MNGETPIDLLPIQQRSEYEMMIKAFKQGLLMGLPVIILVIVFYLLIKLFAEFLAPVNSVFFQGPKEETPWYIYLFTICLLGGFFICLGLLVRNRSGHKYYSRFENRYLSHLPLYDAVRDTINHFTRLSQMPFTQVVLVDPFGTGVLLTGFITEHISSEMFTVFVPTAPNPMNGNIYHVPRSKITFVDCRSHSALRTIVGMGAGSSSLFINISRSEINPEDSR
ncbi:MAG: DUF502 domain-containing protein [Saprospiraceae bacterium]|nr:DUF502 domain-containing protein [Saprospiraceae bacterium]